MIAGYVATWVAMLVEVFSGLPSPISVIPVLFIFAPGSAAVLAVVGQMHMDLGDSVDTNTASWESLVMQAFSYGAGMLKQYCVCVCVRVCDWVRLQYLFEAQQKKSLHTVHILNLYRFICLVLVSLSGRHLPCARNLEAVFERKV